MMKHFLLIALLPLVFVGVSSSAPIIREISVEHMDGGAIDRDSVLAHTRLVKGAELSRLDAAKDTRELLDTGRFSSVDVMIEALDDSGVSVIYVVRPKARLAADINVKGNSHLGVARIQGLFALSEGDLVDDPTVGAAVQRVLKEYHGDHYYDVTVEWDMTNAPSVDDGVLLTLSIDEGDRCKVKRLRIDGNSELGDSTLRKAVKKPAPWNVFRWFFKRTYDESEFEEIRSAVTDVYLEHGFLDVNVAPIRFSELTDDGCIYVEVRIEEGDVYHVGDVQIAGNTLFPQVELDELGAPLSGEVAALSRLERNRAAILKYYNRRGYADTAVMPQATSATGGVIDITYRIAEGTLTHIRDIGISGNTRTRDKVIRRELLVSPGDLFDQTRISRCEKRLMNLGFFARVRAREEPSDEAGKRDVVFEVEEKRTGQFMMGAGFSSVENFTGFAELSQGNFDLKGWPNFIGGGQKLRLRAEFGTSKEDYQLSFVEPWFMDRKLSLGIDLYGKERDYSDYDLKSVGGAISITKPLPGANRLRLQYRLQELQIKDVADTNVYYAVTGEGLTDETFLFNQDERKIKSSLTTTVTHDMRDSAMLPTRGLRASLSGTLAGGPLGFDTDYYSLNASFAQYFPLWFRHVLSLRMETEVIDAFGDTDEIPLSDRMFLGGGRTLRGFEYRDVGPKVAREQDDGSLVYRPRGGQTKALAKAEYTVPLFPGFRLAAFYDIGNVWLDPYEYDLDSLASSAGLGLRLDMPGFPMRIDRGWVIEKDEEFTEEDPWVFWVGYDN